MLLHISWEWQHNPPVTYDLYKARFYSTVPSLFVCDDCLLGIPLFVSSAPNVWHFKWTVEFLSDKQYIRCHEGWSSRRGNPARRYLFSLHYGPGPTRTATGDVVYDHTDPVTLRLDKKNNEPEHLHYLSPTPHYGQARVKGLVIDDVDLIAFLSAVVQHRATGAPFDQLLGFTVA